jgi:2-hydroxy-3-keto-5-methylthiopentenyl-1-phosphate phosphatase
VTADAVRAPAPTPPRPGDLPVAFLVDYDGTIALTDVSDALMAEFVNAEWEAKVAEYDAGLAGSRRLMAWEVALITAPAERLTALAAAQPHDPGFASFVAVARAAGALVEVVSDGFGFFIPAALEALGVGDVPVVTADTRLGRDGESPTISFPNGDPACFVCGTCKRDRVLAHRAAGRRVVFIGDGESDRYAAGYSDVVFAKHSLVRICLDNGWPFERWTDFGEIESWTAKLVTGWRVGGPDALPAAVDRPLFCGAEVWGPGRIDPALPAP